MIHVYVLTARSEENHRYFEWSLEWVAGFRELALSVDVVDRRELEVIKSPRTN